MKNSAWHQKLWRKKLSGLPLREDATTSWSNMKDMLDQQLPVKNIPGNTGVKPFPSKLISLAGYIVPGIALLCAAAYLLLHTFTTPKSAQIKKKQSDQLSQKLNVRNMNRIDKNNRAKRDTTSPMNAADSKNQPASLNTDSADKHTGIIHQNTAAGSGSKKTGLTAIAKPGSSAQNNLGTSNMPVANMPTHTSGRRTANAGPNKSRNLQQQHSVLSIISLHLKSADTDFVHDSNTGNTQFIFQHTSPDSAILKALQSSNQSMVTGIIQRQVDAPGDITQKSRPRINLNQKSAASKAANDRKSPKNGDPFFNYGLTAGLNTGTGSSIYYGALGSFRLNSSWAIQAGVRLNTAAVVAATYTHPSFYRPDSLPAFKVTSTRSLSMVNVPVTAEYRITGRISLHAGAIVSLPVKQSGISNKFGKITNPLDTLSHGNAIDSALKRPIANKINLGITGGISIQLNHFYIDGRYLQNLTPYKFSSSITGNESYKSIQIGIRYMFK